MRWSRSIPVLVAWALVTAACTGGEDSVPADVTTTTASSQSTTTTSESTTTTTGDGPVETTQPAIEAPQLSFSVADGWSATSLGPGTKPVLALDPSGNPAAAWIFERVGEGFIAYAGAPDGWNVQIPREGYFYGPIGLAFDQTGVPHIAIHDHQADDFDPELGDLVRLFWDGTKWARDTVRDEGHDGWDSAIVIGDDGVIHAAGVDPSQFGRVEGIEYYRYSGDEWEITPIGSGPIPYQYNIGLALDLFGTPTLTYYNDTDQDLVFARLDGAEWTLERAATEGDVGKYSSLAYDEEGRPAVSFFRQTDVTEGEIVFAVKDGDSWSSETVGLLTGFSEANARRNSSLAFDSQGRAHVAFSDTTGVWYAIRDGGAWQIDQIVTAGLPLGQLVSLVIDGSDTPHLGIYEVTQEQPLDGSIAYLTTQ